MLADGTHAQDPIDGLEARLGDPADPDNPLGHDAVVAADERGEMLAEVERILDDYVLNAEFVPRSLGGRFMQADRLALTMRSLFRRDAALGLGYGMSSFIAAVPVWTSGSTDQRRWVADLLLGNRRLAAGYTELAHGGDLSHVDLRAARVPHGFALSGGKQLISNAVRADALTLFARTAPAPGSRSHSHLLVDLTTVPPGRIRRSRRFPTSGMRALLLGGVEFQDCVVPADSVVGEPGGAMETVSRAFQVTRTVLPGMAIGVLDTQLRLVTGFAVERVLYGRPLAELPQVRSVLVDAFLDLLTCDSLATVAARALHVLPGQTSIYAAAVKYLVPNLLHESNYRLSTVLGARSYLREGPYAAFQKNTRDLAVGMLAHASSAACQAGIITQLPRLARQSRLTAPAPPPSLFRLGESLPELDFAQLRVSAKGDDNLSATLLMAGELSAEPDLVALCRLFMAELLELRRAVDDLAPRDRTVVAGPAAFDLASRYATLLAASACLGIWWHNQDHAGTVPRDTSWIVAVLHRLARRLGPGPSVADADGIERRLYAELRSRLDRGRTFDLTAGRLAG